jgi:hypothetical protein
MFAAEMPATDAWKQLEDGQTGAAEHTKLGELMMRRPKPALLDKWLLCEAKPTPWAFTSDDCLRPLCKA